MLEASSGEELAGVKAVPSARAVGAGSAMAPRPRAAVKAQVWRAGGGGVGKVEVRGVRAAGIGERRQPRAPATGVRRVRPPASPKRRCDRHSPSVLLGRCGRAAAGL